MASAPQAPARTRRLPAVALACITPVLTELLSGNIQAPVFFLPWVYLFLLIVYGLPVLLVRELYLAWNLSLPGLFLLGLAYGIFNEGVCAKTLLLSVKVPIDAFDHYTFLGVNFPWAALILPWHAVHAMIFPIALVTWWFPGEARTPWLPARAFRIIVVLLLLLGSLIYLVNKQHVTSPIYLLFFWAVMAALIFFSKRMPRTPPFLGPGGPVTLGAVAAGVTFYPILVLGLAISAGLKFPGVAICLLAILLLAAYYRLLSRRGWFSLTPFVLFALGDYFSGALFTGVVLLVRGSLVDGITELVLMAIFVAGIRKMRREIVCQGRDFPA